MRTTYRMTTLLALALLAAGGLAIAGEPGAGVDAQAAFDKLKALEGTWKGTAAGSGEGEEGGEMGEVVHEIEVSAGGSVVMETMMPGTGHEMINMYHLDGDDLVLTHYCAGGNQPTMRLDRAKATASELPFTFTGGTNLDPATDPHIHDTILYLPEDGTFRSHWRSYAAGEKAGDMVFTLHRAEG